MPKKILIGLLCLFPVALYFWYLYTYANNLPNEDDLPAIFDFINQGIPFTSHSWRLLFVPFREHVILLTKIAAAIQYTLQGEIDLRTLIWVGNLAWVAVLIRLYQWFRSLNQPLIYFLPIPFILFQAQFSELSFWAMAIWSNMLVVWLSLEAYRLLVLNKSRFAFPSALLLAGCAPFVNGNGVAVLLVGLVVLFVKREPMSKLLVWTLVGVVAIYQYSVFRATTQVPNDYGMTLNPLQIVLGVATFVGSYFDFISGSFKALAVSGGLVIVVGTVYLAVIHYKSSHSWSPVLLQLLAMLLFIFATAGATALFRTGQNGLDALLLGRYRHYSALTVSCFYLLLLHQTSPRRRFSKVLLMGSLFIGVVALLLSYYRDLGYRYMEREKLVADYYNTQFNDILYIALRNPPPIQKSYQAALTRGTFRGEADAFFTKPIHSTPLTDTSAITVQWEIESENHPTRCQKIGQISTDAVHFSVANGESWFWVVQNAQRSYLFPATARKSKMADLKREISYFGRGLEGEIPLCQLATGSYQVYLMNQSLRFYSTGVRVLF